MAQAAKVEQVMADALDEARTLERNGHAAQAETIRRLCKAFSEANEPHMTFMPERDAVLWSNKSVDWLRSRFDQWERHGFARANPTNPRERQYLQCILPRRVQLDIVRATARRAARGEKSA